jgi:hypothetical protein
MAWHSPRHRLAGDGIPITFGKPVEVWTDAPRSALQPGDRETAQAKI